MAKRGQESRMTALHPSSPHRDSGASAAGRNAWEECVGGTRRARCYEVGAEPTKELKEARAI